MLWKLHNKHIKNIHQLLWMDAPSARSHDFGVSWDLRQTSSGIHTHESLLKVLGKGPVPSTWLLLLSFTFIRDSSSRKMCTGICEGNAQSSLSAIDIVQKRPGSLQVTIYFPPNDFFLSEETSQASCYPIALSMESFQLSSTSLDHHALDPPCNAHFNKPPSYSLAVM